MMECNANAMVIKLLPSFFHKCNHIMHQPKFLRQGFKLNSYIYPPLSFALNEPIITCTGVSKSFKKFITRANVCTLGLDIQRSKLVETMAIDQRFGNTFKSMTYFYYCKKHFIHKNSLKRKGNLNTLA